MAEDLARWAMRSTGPSASDRSAAVDRAAAAAAAAVVAAVAVAVAVVGNLSTKM